MSSPLCLEIQGLLFELTLNSTAWPTARQIDVPQRSGKEALEVGPPDAGKGRIWTLRRARCDRRILAARRRGASSKVFKRSSQIPSRSGGRRALLVTVVRERSDRILMHAKLRDGD